MGTRVQVKGPMETGLSTSLELSKLHFNKLVLGFCCGMQDFKRSNSIQTPMPGPGGDFMEMERSGGDISSANGADQQSHKWHRTFPVQWLLYVCKV